VIAFPDPGLSVALAAHFFAGVVVVAVVVAVVIAILPRR